nr:hypothetical protein [Halomarina sp. PSR21]
MGFVEGGLCGAVAVERDQVPLLIVGEHADGRERRNVHVVELVVVFADDRRWYLGKRAVVLADGHLVDEPRSLR